MSIKMISEERSFGLKATKSLFNLSTVRVSQIELRGAPSAYDKKGVPAVKLESDDDEEVLNYTEEDLFVVDISLPSLQQSEHKQQEDES
jgi:hypothetical protein